ncbi:hypothetical protein ACF0H5_022129 [Mactra antiquata]
MYVYFLNETRANGKVESGSNYKFMCPMNFEFQDEEYLKTRFIILRCYVGQFENIPTTCVARRCRWNNDDIALRKGTTKLSVIEHNQQVHVKCKSTRHELYNPETSEYQERFYVWCVYGKFQNFVNELKCLPKRCDTSQLKNIRVSDLNNLTTDKFVQSDNEYLLRCNFNYEFMEYPEKEYIKKRCDYGNFERVSSCVPKKCLLRNDDIILLDRGKWRTQDVNHNNEGRVQCKLLTYKLYNPGTGDYKEPFDVRCNYGKFSEVVNELTCRPRTNFKYVVSMSIANHNHASTFDNVYVKIIGKDRTTREFIMPTATKGKLTEIYFEDIDVTPIEKVVIRKDTTLVYDDNALIYYVSIFVEESDEYYMFKDRHSENKWLKTNAPKTFTIAAHPEPCRHTYGSAVNRSPKQRSSITKYTSVRGCKQYCVTYEKIKCASVHFMPHNKSKMGHCLLYKVSAFSTTYFRESYRSETEKGIVSYNRICLMK